MLGKELACVWTDVHICVWSVLQKYGHDIKEASGMTLSHISYTRTAIVPTYTSSVDSLKTLVNYAGSFQMVYGIQPQDCKTKNTVGSIVSSYFLSKTFHHLKYRYACFAELQINTWYLLPALRKQIFDDFGQNRLGILYLDRLLLYGDAVSLFMVKIATRYEKKSPDRFVYRFFLHFQTAFVDSAQRNLPEKGGEIV